jgi:hypothetical protein
MDDDRILTGHIPDMDTSSQEHLSARLYRMDGCMIKDRDIPLRHDRPFDP